MKKKRIILLILIIAICVTIFYFSNEPADESSDTSSGFIKFLLEINPLTANLEEKVKIELQESMQYIVRKCAHFSIYALLGLLLMIYTNTYNLKLIPKALISFFAGISYAVTDEVHQYFIPGRSCEFRDVCIDGSGVILGILIVTCIILIDKKLKRE